MFTIFRFTFREFFTRKVLLVSLIMAAVFLGLYWTGVFYAVRDIEKAQNQMLASVIYPQLLLFGLYFGSFIVSFLAILSSAGIISSEVESGVIQAVIPKPVSRSEIVLGKFLGQGVFLAAYAALLFAAIYAIIYTKTGMKLTGSGEAALLFSLQPVVLMSVTFLLSVLTTTVASGMVAFMLYAVAVVGGVIEQIGWFMNNLSLKNAGIVSSLIMPVDSLYRKIVHVMLPPASNPMSAVQQMGPFGSSAEPSLWMVTYAALYILAFLGLSLYYFAEKDI
ncbi:MAG: hypothetical protein VR68_09610 [Peptococcaceae bacterium BRH_c4a]|nr:MAG: hypothetical protein VR68_09610 [Peptococcaceae bacterium BRH_c4a]